MPHPFDGIDAKLRRADEHIEQVETDVEAFLSKYPDHVVSDIDPDAAEAFKSRLQSCVIPTDLTVVVGEGIHQLRSALDHMLCVFVQQDGGTPHINTQFPIFTYRPTKPDEIARYERQISGIDPTSPFLAAIERHQPYHSRHCDRHWLTILKRLNNMDKHRALLLTVVLVRPMMSVTLTSEHGRFAGIETFPDDGTSTEELRSTFGDLQVMDVKRKLSPAIAVTNIQGIPDPQPVIGLLERLEYFTTGLVDEGRSLL